MLFVSTGKHLLGPWEPWAGMSATSNITTVYTITTSIRTLNEDPHTFIYKHSSTLTAHQGFQAARRKFHFTRTKSMLCHTPLLSQILHWWKVCQLSNYFLDKWSFSALFFTCFLTLVLVFSLRASFNCFFLSCKSNTILWITCELILHVLECVCVCVRERERKREMRWAYPCLSTLGS